MAKKAVATFKDKAVFVQMTKVIRPFKNEETGSYSFKVDMVPTDKVQDLLKGSK